MQTKTLQAGIINKSSDGGPGTFEAVLSMPTVDRDNEVVVAHALEPLPNHISIDVDHALSVEKTVASGRPFYAGDVLKIAGSYSSTPLGQHVRTLVGEGHIRGLSVVIAFAQKERRDDGITYITKGELINATFTGIPSNREAMVLASKRARPVSDALLWAQVELALADAALALGHDPYDALVERAEKIARRPW